ncbi:MAG: hypothetical protein WCF18_20930, partial [Chthoniobacteraceae bacterium]
LWIGIDITHLVISLIEKRLKDAFSDKAKQPGGLAEISRGSCEANTPGTAFRSVCAPAGARETGGIFQHPCRGARICGLVTPGFTRG